MAAAPPPRPPRQRSGDHGVGETPTSRQLDFYQAMNDFRHMFPSMEEEVIEAVLRANNGAVDETIDQLLTMSIDEGQTQDDSTDTAAQPNTVRLTDTTNTNNPQEHTESSDSEPSIDLVDDNQLSNSPEISIVPRPRPRPSTDSIPHISTQDTIMSANNLLSQSSIDKTDLDFIGSSSIRINPSIGSHSPQPHSSSLIGDVAEARPSQSSATDMLLDLSSPQEATSPSKVKSGNATRVEGFHGGAILDDLSPVNSESAAPAMPPKMSLLGNRKYASSTHWSPQKPPLENKYKRWNPPLLGDLPDDFLRIVIPPTVSRHCSNVHSDFYGPEHVNKSQLAGSRGGRIDDRHRTPRHHHPMDDSVMNGSNTNRVHRQPPSRSQSMRSTQHKPHSHSRTDDIDGFTRTSKRSSFGGLATNSCTFNSGAMPTHSISPGSMRRGSDNTHTSDHTSTNKGTRTWSPIRSKHKSKPQGNHYTTGNETHHHHHAAPGSSHHTSSSGSPHTGPLQTHIRAGKQMDTATNSNTQPRSKSLPPQSAQHQAAQQQALDSRVLQKRIVENARQRSAVSSNTNPEHVRYLEDEQLALMLQNDEFLAVLMSDNDFVQALERDRMNATAFEPPATTEQQVHADNCPLSTNPTPDSRFGDDANTTAEEHMEFRRRLELMGGSSKTKFATIARKFFSRKKKKSPMKYKVPSLRSNIAPSTANLLEEEEDGDMDLQEESAEITQSEKTSQY